MKIAVDLSPANNHQKCLTCAGFQRWKQASYVSASVIFLLGWEIYARTNVKLSRIKAATAQFTSKITERNSVIACELPCESSHDPYCLSAPFPDSHVFSHFLSVKGCLAFKKILFLLFAFIIPYIRNSSRLGGSGLEVFEML